MGSKAFFKHLQYEEKKGGGNKKAHKNSLFLWAFGLINS
jgi:hypothetical protein